MCQCLLKLFFLYDKKNILPTVQTWTKCGICTLRFLFDFDSKAFIKD